MARQWTDPDQRKYDREDEWVTCPKCGYPMSLLRDATKVQDTGSLEDDDPYETIYRYGWFEYFLEFVDEKIMGRGRQKKLMKLKSEVVPEFPNSLVCLKCLEVKMEFVQLSGELVKGV